MNRYLKFILLLSTIDLQAADRSGTEKSDSILDKLEQKLLEQEASTLNITAPSRKKILPTKQSYKAPETQISGKLPLEDEFAAIDKSVQEIEAQVEDLSQRVEKIRSDFIDKSQQSSLIELQLQLENPEETFLKELTISIDQHVVYEVREDLSPWQMRPQISIYSGPLAPGNHLVTFKARVVRKEKDKIPLDQNIYHIYNQNLSLDIPVGNARRGYRIRIGKPEEQNTFAKAALETYEIP